MSEHDEVLAGAQVAAAEAIDIPGPAPEPEALDTELPEGEDTFDRPYVEKLRAEAASKRTELRTYKDAFEGYTPAETARYLELATMLNRDPEAAMEEFRGVSDRLAQQLGKEAPVAEEVIPTVPAEAPAAALSAEDINRIVGEQMQAEREVDAQAQANRNVFAEAAALSDSYSEGSPELVSLLAVAQNDPAAEGTLAGAHAIMQAKTIAIEEAAVDAYRQSLRSGKAHPPVVSGQPATPGNQEPPKTIAEASARAKERFAATYGD